MADERQPGRPPLRSPRGSAPKPPPRAVRQRVYSQNFLIDRRATEALADGSGVGPGDLVLDIGAGNGLITQALARRGARVVAIERDPALVRRLRARFGPGSGVTVVAGDVLTAPLPAEPFAVVANIPFGITTKILRRLLDPAGQLRRADVIVQAEVARKRGARDRGHGAGRGTLLNALWEPWFGFGVGQRVPRAAFRPQPRVDGAVLVISRRATPLLNPELRRDYTEFVTAAFTGARPTVASALTRPLPGTRPAGRARFAQLAGDLGFPAGALPSDLAAEQWAGLFLAARGLTGRAGPRPPAGRPAHGPP
jgi:23S rRNA (adenine-N6)-dimethyltransferase